MDNMERIIDAHNKKILQKTTPAADNCNCNKSAKWHCGRHTLICKKILVKKT